MAELDFSQATNSSESYFCLTVDREYEFFYENTVNSLVLNHNPVIFSKPVNL